VELGKRATLKREPNIPDWSKAFHELYRALKCSTQEEFAVRIGSKQGTVSTWLRGDEARRPSTDTFLRMSALVTNIDPALASRFMRLAGISDDVILAIAGNLSKEVFTPCGSAELVNVLPSEESPEALGGGPLSFQSRLVPDPMRTRYMVVGRDFLRPRSWYRWDLLHRGDILLLDVSQNMSATLLPFWDLHVVVKIGGYPALGGPGLLAGRLMFISSTGGYSARLSASFGDDPEAFEVGVLSAPHADDWPPARESVAALREHGNAAKAQIRLYAPHKIVGILTGWLRAPRSNK
jgi:transcriptional regulator with XRE-family HTH domain